MKTTIEQQEKGAELVKILAQKSMGKFSFQRRVDKESCSSN
jgi:hypothetical protein